MKADGFNERVSVRMPPELIEQLEELVDDGEYSNRSDAIRSAARELVRETDDDPRLDRPEPTNRADLWGGGDA
jgi:antitoxin ParD1/3/4